MIYREHKNEALAACQVPFVFITMLLACVVLLKQSLARILNGRVDIAIAAAFPLAALLLLLLLLQVRRVRSAQGPSVGGGGRMPTSSLPGTSSRTHGGGARARTGQGHGLVEVTLSAPP